jgi:ubiquinone/menaquinone biosynthesis C-methylase UbiE
MWYWIIKIQSMLFVPLYAGYCLLRGRAFHFRCKKCRAWLDTLYMAGGLCEKCHRDIVLSDPINYFIQSGANLRQLEVGRVAFQSNHMRHLMYRRVARTITSGKVLDVGCGQGYLFMELPSRPQDLYGIDLGEYDIRRASRWIAGGNFCIADGRYLPYRTDTFNCIVCSEVLEHLPDVPSDNVIKECYRVLKPGGTAIFTVPNGNGTAGRSDAHHIRYFTFKSITGLLEEAGFSITRGKKVGLYIPVVSRFIELLNGTTGNRLPVIPFLDIEVPEWLSMTFVIECRKMK